MKITKLILTSLIILLSITSQGQNVKFGKVSKQELQEKFYSNDTSANAVVLYKKRRTNYVYNQNSGWELKTEVHERIKIYNAEGFNYATNKVHLFTRGGEDETLNIKGYTFNLDGNSIEKTKLDKDQIFREELNENWIKKTYTMPNLKDGCIVEWKYEIYSPYYSNINDVVCQYKIPIKQLDIHIQIPEYFQFKFLPNGFYPINVKQGSKQQRYNIAEKSRQLSGGLGGGVAQTNVNYSSVNVNEFIYTVDQKNIPALKTEPYINNLYNYVAKIKFEFTAYKPKYGIPKYFNNTWGDVTKSIYENQYFGEQLSRSGYFNDELETILATHTDQSSQIMAIFEFVKGHMRWNEEYGKYVNVGGIKKAYNAQEGNVAEINLMLTAMLREAGINANPILVSTRKHGVPLIPTKEGFNYVISGIERDGKTILLDATEKYSVPGVLPLRDLNWRGRLVRKDGTSKSINLFPNKYSTKQVIVRADMDELGTISGFIRSSYSNLQALNYRNEYNHIAEDELITDKEKEIGAIEIEKIKVTNKNNPYKPIVENIKFISENQADIINDKIYLPPMLFYAIDENPFKQEERNYPIDFGTPWQDEITIHLKLPQNFEVTSLPEPSNVVLPDNLGSFQFGIKQNNNSITVISKSNINAPIIAQNYYGTLKELYKLAIEKQLEKIVLTKS